MNYYVGHAAMFALVLIMLFVVVFFVAILLMHDKHTRWVNKKFEILDSRNEVYVKKISDVSDVLKKIVDKLN
jgi:hypothetical protein